MCKLLWLKSSIPLKTHKIAQVISAAIAIHTSPESVTAVKAESLTETVGSFNNYPEARFGDRTADLIATTTQISASLPAPSFNMMITPRDSWNAKAMKKYRMLVAKEALNDITLNEAKELKGMEVDRLAQESTLTGEQILVNYRRQKVGFEMVQLLGKYVRIVPQKQDSTERNAAEVHHA